MIAVSYETDSYADAYGLRESFEPRLYAVVEPQHARYAVRLRQQ
jgi:hypothetical protein